MRTLFKLAAIAGLLLVLVPGVVFYGPGGLPAFGKTLMLFGTVLWFMSSFLAFRQNRSQLELEDEHTPVA